MPRFILQSFSPLKNDSRNKEATYMMGEHLFNNTLDRGLSLKIYKELQKLNPRMFLIHLVNRWVTELNREFSKREIN